MLHKIFRVIKSYHGKRGKMITDNKQTRMGEERVKVKVKAIPLQAWISLEGSRRLRLPDFKKIGT